MVSEKDLDEGTLFPVIGMKDTGSVIKRTAPEFIITLTVLIICVMKDG